MSLPVLSSNASSMVSIVVIFLIFAIFYLLLIRPQRKRDKQLKAMVEALRKGDKVVTIGGIHGTVITVKSTTVVVKVDDSARIEFNKSAISSVLTKDSAKKEASEEKVSESETLILENKSEENKE